MSAKHAGAAAPSSGAEPGAGLRVHSRSRAAIHARCSTRRRVTVGGSGRAATCARDSPQLDDERVVHPLQRGIVDPDVGEQTRALIAPSTRRDIAGSVLNGRGSEAASLAEPARQARSRAWPHARASPCPWRSAQSRRGSSTIRPRLCHARDWRRCRARTRRHGRVARRRRVRPIECPGARGQRTGRARDSTHPSAAAQARRTGKSRRWQTERPARAREEARRRATPGDARAESRRGRRWHSGVAGSRWRYAPLSKARPLRVRRRRGTDRRARVGHRRRAEPLRRRHCQRRRLRLRWPDTPARAPAAGCTSAARETRPCSASEASCP